MKKNTKMTTNELKDVIIRFVRVFGAGIIAIALMVLAGMAQGPEVILITAVIVAIDKYLRDKGITEQVYKTTIGRFTK